VKKLSDRDVVAREYATTDRLAMRRLDRTAWLDGDEPCLLALAAIAEVRPARVLDSGGFLERHAGHPDESVAAPRGTAVLSALPRDGPPRAPCG
jgi:hypothetical protein